MRWLTGLSLAVLVRDLGRPGRFVHMLPVVKPTSPMSIGTWLLSGFSPLVAVAALDEVSGVLPRRWADLVRVMARPGGLAATALAPAVTTYTGALIADTAIPVWHEAYRELPYLFRASALAAAGGLVAAASPAGEAAPVRVVGIAGSVAAQVLDRAVPAGSGWWPNRWPRGGRVGYFGPPAGVSAPAPRCWRHRRSEGAGRWTWQADSPWPPSRC